MPDAIFAAILKRCLIQHVVLLLLTIAIILVQNATRSVITEHYAIHLVARHITLAIYHAIPMPPAILPAIRMLVAILPAAAWHQIVLAQIQQIRLVSLIKTATAFSTLRTTARQLPILTKQTAMATDKAMPVMPLATLAMPLAAVMIPPIPVVSLVPILPILIVLSLMQTETASLI